MDINEYTKRFEELVELERREEMEAHEREISALSGREREEKGRALLNMRGKDAGKGLGGKYIVKFRKTDKSRLLPENEMGGGDLVLVSSGDPLKRINPAGSIAEMTEYTLSAAFDEKPPEFCYGKGLRIDLYVNDVTFQRMLSTLKGCRRAGGRRRKLLDILLGNGEACFHEAPNPMILNKELNDSQREAALRSLAAEYVHLVHGPPGTGKTTTLIEVIRQLIRSGERVLAAADSNTAVDNLLEKLTEKGEAALRIGHPARVTETLRKHTLDYIVEKHPDYKKAAELREKAFTLKNSLDQKAFTSGEWRRGLSNQRILKLAAQNRGSRGISPKRMKEAAKRVKTFEEMDRLFDRARILENRAVKRIMRSHPVICATNSVCGSDLLSGRKFNTAVIDEATQATEPSCLLPINISGKVIMAGDHRQLPPTVISEKAARKNLSRSMFERLADTFGEGVTTMLDVQYRMNEKIMFFASARFYGNTLKADKSVKNHLLCGLEGVEHRDFTLEPLTYVDTSCLDTAEYHPADSNILWKHATVLINISIDLRKRACLHSVCPPLVRV